MVVRGIRRALVVTLATLAFSSFAITSSSGVCAPPTIAFEGSADQDMNVVSPGDRVSLVGASWTPDCFDTGPIGACQRGPGDERPTRGIDVDLVRSGNVITRVVDNLDAAPDLTIAVTFTVPELAAGRYEILVHDRGQQGEPHLVMTIRE